MALFPLPPGSHDSLRGISAVWKSWSRFTWCRRGLTGLSRTLINLPSWSTWHRQGRRERRLSETVSEYIHARIQNCASPGDSRFQKRHSAQHFRYQNSLGGGTFQNHNSHGCGKGLFTARRVFREYSPEWLIPASEDIRRANLPVRGCRSMRAHTVTDGSASIAFYSGGQLPVMGIDATTWTLAPYLWHRLKIHCCEKNNLHLWKIAHFIKYHETNWCAQRDLYILYCHPDSLILQKCICEQEFFFKNNPIFLKNMLP